MNLVTVHGKNTKRAAPPAFNYGERDEYEQAKRNLARLGLWRADDYQAWVEVGMALSCLGTVGLPLWRTWSAASSKFKQGECDKKWGSFTRNGGKVITLASLAHWAAQDDPRPTNPRAPAAFRSTTPRVSMLDAPQPSPTVGTDPATIYNALHAALDAWALDRQSVDAGQRYVRAAIVAGLPSYDEDGRDRSTDGWKAWAERELTPSAPEVDAGYWQFVMEAGALVDAE